MAEPLTTGYLKEIMHAHGLSPNHMLGQNFLVEPDVFAGILAAADISPADIILEIGAGIGRLTSLLADRARHVLALEIDAGLFSLASERLADRKNVLLLHADFLATKHRICPEVSAHAARLRGDRPIKVVANLPYQISSPAIINLLQWAQPVESMHVMLQKEVAERLTAAPGQPQYGPLSVFAAYSADISILFRVPPSAFWPRPDVSSAVVKLTKYETKIRAKDYKTFTELVNALFQNRRKMLRKTIRLQWGEEAALTALEKTGINGTRRAEQLSIDEFIAIANALPDTAGGGRT